MDAKTPADKGGSWLRRWLAAAVAVPLAATLWTLPLQVLHFGVVPLWAVPANVLAAPLLTPLTLGSMAVALLDLVAPPLTGVLLGPLGALAGLLLQLAHGFAQLPMAQWQTGRPQPWLVLGLALGLLGWLVPGLRRRWRLLASGLLVLVVSIHVASLRADALMLVRDGHADLLLARHQGRAALVASSADGFSCRRAARLAAGLGSPRYDWVLSLDPLASPEPHCWRTLAPLVLLSGDDSTPLGPGQRLRSQGLAIEALSAESNALQLQFGGQRWLLLPDRGSLQAWRHSPKASNLAGLWLGFQPHAGERRWLEAQTPRRVWISGRSPAAAQLPKGWQISGERGSLVTAGS
jgi:competence protein ComEC